MIYVAEVSAFLALLTIWALALEMLADWLIRKVGK